MMKRIGPSKFTILAMAPFRAIDIDRNLPEAGSSWTDPPIRISDRSDVEDAMAKLQVSVSVPVPETLDPSGFIDLPLTRIKDFHPDSIVKHTGCLKNLLDAKTFIKDSRTRGLSADQINTKLEAWPNLPDVRVEAVQKAPEKSSSSVMDDILNMASLPGEEPDAAPSTMDAETRIDGMIRQGLNLIFSNPVFRRMESAWRGLDVMLKQGGDRDRVEVRIVPVCADTLEQTLNSVLADMITDLPGMAVMDLFVDSSPRSMELVEEIGRFSETLLAPSITSISPGFFHIDNWQDLKRMPYLPHLLDEPPFAKWNTFRRSSSAAWVGLACNRFLARYPYGPDNTPRTIGFTETSGPWVNPAWAVGCFVAKSVSAYGWPTRFTEWQQIRMEDLPLNTSEPDVKIPVETELSEDRIRQLTDCGVMPLVAPENRDIAFLPRETASGGQSLRYQALVSRMAHFLIDAREKLGTEIEAEDTRNDLETAFMRFLEDQGLESVPDFRISVFSTPGDDRSKMRLELEPPRRMLTSGQKVEIEFLL